MLWRKFQLDWAYAFGELVIVTVGVLIALGIDEWRQDLENRDLEIDYAHRLKSDLREDISRFENYIDSSLRVKVQVLEELIRVQNDPTGFRREIIDGASLDISSYKSVPETQSSAYRELQSTGAFRLIRNSTLRTQIEDYYDAHELLSEVLKEPIGQYRLILSSSLSGSAFLKWRVDGVEIPETNLLEGISTVINHPDFESAANAELAYAARIIFWLRLVGEAGEKLLAELDRQYPD